MTLYVDIVFNSTCRVFKTSKNPTSFGGLDGRGMRKGNVGRELEFFHILSCRLHVCKFTE